MCIVYSVLVWFVSKLDISDNEGRSKRGVNYLDLLAGLVCALRFFGMHLFLISE